MAKNEELMEIVGVIRYKHRLNQGEIAAKIGVSRQYLSDALNGRYPFSDDLRDKLRNAFPDLLIIKDAVMDEEEKQRLDEYLRHKGITQKKFQQMIRQNSTNQKDTGADPVQLVSLTFPDLNRNWLLTGKGDMLLYNDPSVTHKATNERERLQIVIDNEGLKTATGLAKAIGYNQSNLSKVMTGRWGMNANLAAAVNRVYPQYSVAWLMTGEDDNAVMVEEKSVQEVGSNRRGAKFLSDDHGQLYIQVPHVPYAARAEFANISDTLEPYREEWGTETYEADKRASGLYLSFDVKGDSMDDGSRGSLQDGDKVLVRELERDDWRNPLKYRDHPFWVVVFGSSVLIKQIISEDMESGTITFHSLNPSPEYCDFTLNIDDIRSLYYVIRVKPKSFAL